MCEYVRQHYKVPAKINMRIRYNGEPGIIWKDGGHHICACMDKDKPGQTIRIHPTDPGIEYLEMGEPRKLTRAQQRYRDYLDSLHCEAGDSFADFLGIKSKTVHV